MNSKTATRTQPPSIEQSVKTMVHEFKAKASDTLGTCEEKIRQSPDKAVLIALVTGYCLHVLPTRSLLALPIRLTAFLAKPALLAIGVAKVCAMVQEQTKK